MQWGLLPVKQLWRIANVSSSLSIEMQSRAATSTGIILIAGLSTLFIGATFAIIQFLGESYGFSPIINLGALGWGESGDAIIVIVIIFLSSIFIGTILVLSIIRKKINKL